MRSVTGRSWVLGVMLLGSSAILNPTSVVSAEEFGAMEPGTWVLGMRAGFAPLTQTLTDGTSTHVGSLVNFQAMYSLNRFLLVGMMIEWERRSVDFVNPSFSLGHQDTVSVLPTVELRPARFGPVSPYVNMSFGVNSNGFGEGRNVGRISPSNTFAWRLGWGADYMITKRIALNGEMAYKRNDGHATVTSPPGGPFPAGGPTRVNDWNASSFGFLFGAKLYF